MKVKQILLYIIIAILVIFMFYITYIKFFSGNLEDNPNNKTHIEISLNSDDLKIDNVKITDKDNDKYLIFDATRIDENIQNIYLDISLYYNDDIVFEDNVLLSEFENDNFKKVELNLGKFDYTLSDVSAVFNTNDVITNDTTIFDTPANTG